MSLFNWNTREKCSANVAKERLQTTLSAERCMNIGYSEDLKKDLTLLIQKHIHATHIDIRACVKKHNTLDIQVSII